MEKNVHVLSSIIHNTVLFTRESLSQIKTLFKNTIVTYYTKLKYSTMRINTISKNIYMGKIQRVLNI